MIHRRKLRKKRRTKDVVVDTTSLEKTPGPVIVENVKKVP